MTSHTSALDAAADRGLGSQVLRLVPNIRYGTERYPEKVARRLRVVNITAWLGAPAVVLFAIVRLLTDSERWVWALVTILFAVGIATVPLLHRFGPLAAPLALVAIVYAHIFRVVHQIGTGDGAYLAYLTSAALGMLLVGIEHVRLAVALAAVGAGLTITLHATVPYSTGLVPPLIAQFSMNFVLNTAILFVVVYYAARQTARAEASAEREHARSEALLANILPPRVAARLKDSAEIADSYPEASILFADMAGFTARAADTAAGELVRFLNAVFTQLDAIVERHGLEKIKTTGDAYMVVSGVPEPRPDHAAAIATLALDMRDALTGLVDTKGRAVPVRIGIASGPVVAGVIGTKKLFYDVWGDAVNTASRMETTGEVGKIQVDSETYKLLKSQFNFDERGVVDVRGKGAMRTWFLSSRKSESLGSR